MSGPKLSQAEIERRRLEQLEKERIEALKKLQKAQDAYQSACDKARNFKLYAAQLIDDKDNRIFDDYGYADIRNMIDAIDIAKVSSYKVPDSFYDAANKINRTIGEATNKLEALLKVVSSRAANDQKLDAININNQLFQSIVTSRDGVIEAVTIDFNCQYTQQVLRKQLNDLLIHYRQLALRKDAPEICSFSKKTSQYIEKLLADSSAMNDVDRIRNRMQSLINDEQELIRVWKEKKSLYSDYLALTSVTDRQPKDPNDFADAASLKKEISRLRSIYRKQDEMDYIADQINDAMVSLGYTFVTSRVLTKQDNSETEFSLYKADDQTGISVFTDQSGAVMMRMTVLGDDPVITDDDREFSYQRQIDFCAGHPDLVSALAERGVFLKQKSYQEPDKAHTYKLSINGQNAAADTQTVNKGTKSQKIDRRRRRRASSKKVRAL